MSQIDLQLSSFFHAWANQKKMLTRLDEAHLSKALQVKYSEAAASYITFLYIYLCFDMFCISTWTAPSSSLIFHYHFFHQICEPPALTWGEDNVCPVSIFNSDWHHHRPRSILWPISPMTKGNRTDTKTNPRFSGTTMMIMRQVQYCAVPRAMPCAITFCAPRYQEGDEICPSCAQGQGVKPLWQTGPASLPGPPKNSQKLPKCIYCFYEFYGWCSTSLYDTLTDPGDIQVDIHYTI
jgi:hypothetical protein